MKKYRFEHYRYRQDRKIPTRQQMQEPFRFTHRLHTSFTILSTQPTASVSATQATSTADSPIRPKAFLKSA